MISQPLFIPAINLAHSPQWSIIPIYSGRVTVYSGLITLYSGRIAVYSGHEMFKPIDIIT
ncbi:hypothetical protein GCM10009131_35420 [Morganella psychrotolerans]